MSKILIGFQNNIMSDMTDSGNIRVGVEVCSSALRVACVDGSGELAETRTMPFDGAVATAQQIADLIDLLKRDLGGFDRIGIAVPGLVDRESGRVAHSAHIPEHASVDLLKDIQTATGLSVSLENDANAAAYGEYKLGAARGSENFFYATLGAGVGGAFILGGEIWSGVSGFAGEFGYVTLNSEGMRLEEVASTANIVRRTRSRFRQDSTSSLNSLDEEAIDLAEIIKAANNDDDFSQLMLERTGIYVGTAVAGVINLLNLDRIVVGGEIMQAKHLVLDAIIERARELAFAPSFAAVSIIGGELGDYAAAAGAALLTDKAT